MSLIPFGFWGSTREILKTNLIFHYDPANKISYSGSGATLTDLSGNGHTVTLSGGVGFNATDGGGSLTFDGIDDRGNVTTNAAGAKAKFINQSFTLEAWLKPSSSTPPNTEIYFSILQDGIVGCRLHCRFRKNSDGVDGVNLAYFADDLVSPSYVVEFGVWQHIAMRYTSSTDKSAIFVNGVKVAESGNGGLQSSTGTDIWIGSFGNSEYWKGSVGAIYAYQAALTDEQILSNYFALEKRYNINSLKLYLDAGNTASYPGTGTTWFDLSLQANNGTISGATYNSGSGGHFVFDGVNDIVTLAKTSREMILRNITIETWIKANTGTFGYVISAQNQSNIVPWHLNVKGNNAATLLDGIASYTTTWNNSDIVTDIRGDGNWHHIVGTYDGTTFRYYIDGILNSSATISYLILPEHTLQPKIGTYSNDNQFFSGNIAQLKLYNRALTAYEILNNYQNTKSRY